MLVRAGCCIIMIAIVIGGGFVSPAHAAVPPAAAFRGPIGLTLTGPLTENSKLEVLVTGVLLGHHTGDPDDLLVVLKLNGVTIEVPTLVWNNDEGGWEFDYYLPPGLAGSVVSIAISSYDEDVTRSFTVGP